MRKAISGFDLIMSPKVSPAMTIRSPGLRHFGGRGARHALENRHLAKEVALFQNRQGDVLVGAGSFLDGDPAGLDDVHVLARIAFTKQDFPCLEVGKETGERVLFSHFLTSLMSLSEGKTGPIQDA